MPALTASARGAARRVERWLVEPADPRSYAAVRVGYAATAFCTLVDLWPLRGHLFASELTVDGDALVGTPLNVFRYATAPFAVSVVFVVAGVFSVLLALGVATRTSAVIVYLWVLSYSATARVALGGFDTVLRVIGLVLVVSPAPATWSLGRPERDAGPPSMYGLRMIQWQVMLIYLWSVWLKMPDPYWRAGEVVPYFLMSMFARWPDAGAAHLGAIGTVLTYATVVVEASVPFLLWGRRTRALGVLLGAGMHLSIAIIAKLALFSMAMLSLYPAFLEAADWDRIEAWLRRGTRGRSAA